MISNNKLHGHIFISVPTPVSVTITYHSIGDISADTEVVLNCTVELSPAVDIPVTVNIQLTDPAGSQLIYSSQPVSSSTYTVTVRISSFKGDQSGYYTCTVDITSTSPFLTDSDTLVGVTRITTREGQKSR